MAQRRPSRERLSADVPALRVPRAEASRKIQDRIGLGQELLDRQVSDEQALATLGATFHAWHDYNGTLLLQLFTTRLVHDEYQPAVYSASSSSPDPMRRLQGVRRDIRRQVDSLNSILGQLELYDDVDAHLGARRAAGLAPTTAAIFVVHGQDTARKLEVARFIERITGRRPTILHEQPNRGRTIIEKFEVHAGDAGFAVVLLTGDDVGGSNADSLQPRARQNVVLELGFFMGTLGRGRPVPVVGARSRADAGAEPDPPPRSVGGGYCHWRSVHR